MRLRKIKIEEYEEKYAKEISEIIHENLYKINIKDYSKEFIDKIASKFTEKEIKRTFPIRMKCLIAIENGKIVGTASIDRFHGDETGTKYIILTVFVKIASHHNGIGTVLIKEIEKYAKEVGAKELVIPASIYGCEFYRKLGYEYINGIKELNEDNEFMLIKKL